MHAAQSILVHQKEKLVEASISFLDDLLSAFVITSLTPTLETLKSAQGIAEQHAGPIVNSIDQVYLSIADYFTENSSTIYYSACVEIYRYCEFFCVFPKNQSVDEYKLIYFLGIAFIKELQKEEKSYVEEINLLWNTIFYKLTKALEFESNVWRKDLIDRLSKAVKQNKIDSYLGEYGVYLLYKCQSNYFKEFKAIYAEASNDANAPAA